MADQMRDDLNRWLGMVRPRTDADDGWATSPHAGAVLAEVHSRIADAGKPSRPAQPRTWTRRSITVRVGSLAAVAAAVVVAASLAGSGSGSHSGQAITAPAARPAAMLLHAFSSCADVVAGLRSHAAAHVGPWGFPYQYAGPGPLILHAQSAPGASVSTSPQPYAPAPAGSAGTSTTNVQEPGVDEPDIVKTDGDRVVTLTDGVLRVVDQASRDVVGTLDLTMYDGWQGAQLLVGDGHAVVMLNGEQSYPYYGYYDPYVSEQHRSTYLFVDLNGQPTVTGSLRTSGSYVDARQVGMTIRLVVRSAPSIHFPRRLPRGYTRADRVAANRQVIARAPLATWLPRYSITNGGQTTSATVPCEQISHPTDYNAVSMLSVYTLDLDHLGTSPEPVSIAADGDTVYATSTSLYVASTPQWYCCGTPRTHRTQLHRFDISGTGAPTYLGSGSVPGRLLNHYSMSEYRGDLRVATTMSRRASGESSGVYVLNADTLKVVGHVDGLGANEQIYAVRFIGAMGYVVTFRQFDPLYVIDMRNPAAPKVAGTLDLTGFSAYLHDAGGGRLIGVGQEISSNEPAGMQISLFDVTTPSRPTRIGQVVVPRANGGAPGFDPHTFLYWGPTGLVVVPMRSWDQGQSGRVLVLKVAGLHLDQIGTVANPRPAGTSGGGRGIQRSMIVDDQLWTISGSGIRVSNPDTLASEGFIAFRTP